MFYESEIVIPFQFLSISIGHYDAGFPQLNIS